MKTRAAGYSLVEMIVGLGVSSIVLGGVLGVIGQLSQFENDNRIANLLNQTYYQGVQTARSNVRIKGFLQKLKPELTDCLANRGHDCQSLHQDPPVDLPSTAVIAGQSVTDNTLNNSFGFYGPCGETEAHCLIKRTTKYSWECPNLNPTDPAKNNYCTGVRIEVRAEMLHNAANKLRNPLKARVGSFVLSSRDFEGKNGLSLSCASTSSMISGLDFSAASNQDTCSSFSAGNGCNMPMAIYATNNDCVPQQDKPTCTQGYSSGGLFASHMNCVSTVDLSSVTPTPLSCPGGGVDQGGKCVYANRWCPLSDSDPTHTLGFVNGDPGAVSELGCYFAPTMYSTGAIVATGDPKAPYVKCASGPAADYPLPNTPYCPVNATPPAPTGGIWAAMANPPFFVPIQAVNWMSLQKASCGGQFAPTGACSPLGKSCSYFIQQQNGISGINKFFMNYECVPGVPPDVVE